MATSATIHAFDTLVYAKKLKAGGFTERQAEAQAGALADVVNDNLATKQDLRRLEEKINTKFENLEHKIDHKLEVLETRLIIRLTSINVAVIGLFSGLIIHFS